MIIIRGLTLHTVSLIISASKTWNGSLAFVHLNLLVVQNNVRPPNFIGGNSYELNPIVLNRGPFQFVVVPDLKTHTT